MEGNRLMKVGQPTTRNTKWRWPLILSSAFLLSLGTVASSGLTASHGMEVGDLGMSAISPLVPLLERSPPLAAQDLVPLERRQEANVITDLVNGAPGKLNIEFGKGQYWRIPMKALAIQPEYVQAMIKKKKEEMGKDGKYDERMELRKRQEEEKVKVAKQYEIHLTFNTCLQPQPNATVLNDPPPSLQLYISNSTTNKKPGPKYKGFDQFALNVTQGFANFTANITNDLYIGVYAPNVTDKEDREKWRGVWNYELAVSTWGQFHGYRRKSNVYLVDSDSDSALLITGNMTNIEEASRMPFNLYAQNTNETAAFKGLEHSYCAVSALAQVRKASVQPGMTTRGLGNLPKQQFHITGLNKSTLYQGFLTRPGNVSEGGSPGGGVIWEPVAIETKKDGNCQVIFDLPFCSEVAYAVPANPTKFNSVALGRLYDEYAEGAYKNFSYSLQQIPCNTSSTSRYSLARDCDDCDKAYKTWLCAVAIPRCADFSNMADEFLAPRGLSTQFFNSSDGTYLKNKAAEQMLLTSPPEERSLQKSRNPLIDSTVQPGPYKEIKPCLDLCYSLVQSCPSDFGFSCPKKRSFGQLGSYGERSDDGDITCSYLGAVYFLSAAAFPGISGGFLWAALALAFVLAL